MISSILSLSNSPINLILSLNEKINHLDDKSVYEKVNNIYTRVFFIQKKLSKFGLRYQVSRYIINILNDYKSYLFDDIPNSFKNEYKFDSISICIHSINDIFEIFVYKYLGVKVTCKIEDISDLIEKINSENKNITKQLSDYLNVINENPSNHNIFIILETLNMLHSFHCKSTVTAFVNILINIYDSDITNNIDYTWILSNFNDSVEFYFEEIIPFLRNESIDINDDCFNKSIFEKIDCNELFNSEMLKIKLLNINTSREVDHKKEFNNINKSLLEISEELIYCSNSKLITLFEIHCKLIHDFIHSNSKK